MAPKERVYGVLAPSHVPPFGQHHLWQTFCISTSLGDYFNGFILGTTDVRPVETGTVPEQMALQQNYPNPFGFSLPVAGQTSLKVFNLVGQEVATLLEGTYDRGNYEVPFDGAGLPSGMYFYVLRSNGSTLLQKMALVKQTSCDLTAADPGTDRAHASEKGKTRICLTRQRQAPRLAFVVFLVFFGHLVFDFESSFRQCSPFSVHSLLPGVCRRHAWYV
ncbi:MAG: Por secretion system C-terminal sorting protein [Bacteroidetes bacterium]|nr:Por secretion system C-terminal sorting protein [Bacteroidota bacterium]